ncbi:MAG: MATE family efflux transporter [Oscillospiraceae bacterium]|nr:MATE family efflux transporter [Oscillospiraceae bacterium]
MAEPIGTAEAYKPHSILDRWDNRALLYLIAPLIAERFLMTLVGIIDTSMVSIVGEEAVSGVSLVDSINFILVDLFGALATGGAVVCSQFIGRRENSGAAEASKQLIMTIAAFSLAIMAPVLLFHRQILVLIYGGLDAGVMEAAVVYFIFSAASYPFLAVYSAGAALFRSTGNSLVGMSVSFATNVVHFALNWIFIFNFGWGVAGVAFSLLICRAIAAVVVVWLLLRRTDSPVQISGITRTRPDAKHIRSIMRVAAPNGAEGMMFQIGKLFLARLVASFGTVAIAGNAVANIIINIGNLPGISFAMALLTIVGQCVGAKDYAAAKKLTNKLIKLNYVIMGSLNITFIIFMRQFFRLFNLSPESLDIAFVCGMCFCVGSIFIWTPAYCLPFALRAAGDAKYTMVVAGIAMWAARVGVAYLLAAIFGERVGVLCVWISMCCEWVVRASFFVHRWLGDKWQARAVIVD